MLRFRLRLGSEVLVEQFDARTLAVHPRPTGFNLCRTHIRAVGVFDIGEDAPVLVVEVLARIGNQSDGVSRGEQRL